MFKWLFRIALGYLATKLAEEYLHPSRSTRERSRPGKASPKRRSKRSAAT